MQDKSEMKPLESKEKIRPYDKVKIRWTFGELAGKTTEEHPALAEKMALAGKAEYVDASKAPKGKKEVDK